MIAKERKKSKYHSFLLILRRRIRRRKQTIGCEQDVVEHFGKRAEERQYQRDHSHAQVDESEGLGGLEKVVIPRLGEVFG